jgi:glycosyltransferase involved in cell wall biosynthesis
MNHAEPRAHLPAPWHTMAAIRRQWDAFSHWARLAWGFKAMQRHGQPVVSLSLVICTRNRSTQLDACLKSIENTLAPDGVAIEIIVVDNDSNDDTPEVIARFQATCPYRMQSLWAGQRGSSAAKNVGVSQSTGEWLVFTDDDCQLERHYFVRLVEALQTHTCDYGMGPILSPNPDDDARVARKRVWIKRRIPSLTPIIPTGRIQGANMFARRSIFEKIGGFNELMGAGMPFAGEDIEFACRASHAGFEGAQLTGFWVFHVHGRRALSPEAEQTIHSYDRGRDAYYASMMLRGAPAVWAHWQATFIRRGRIRTDRHDRLARELARAAEYLQQIRQRQGPPEPRLWCEQAPSSPTRPSIQTPPD